MAIASTLRATSGAEVGRNPALKSLLRNIEMEQGHRQHHFQEWNLALVLSALTKPPFELLDQASRQLLTWKTVILIALASGKRWGEIHAFEHARLQQTTGWTQVTLLVGLSFTSKTQVLGKGLKCLLSWLCNGMSENRLLCPVHALRFYLERSMSWREHKRLLFVSFKPGHKWGIYHPQSPGGSSKRFWSATQNLYTSPPVPQGSGTPYIFCELVLGAVITSCVHMT